MARPESTKQPRALTRLWRWFWSPTGRFSLGGIFIVGGIAGIVFWGGFNTFMAYSNTEEFCTSCHEMREFVFAEYEGSIHDRNPSGVRATCPDCHVPKEWTPKLIRKVKATNELYHKILGTISTREKFEAARLDLAGNVWRTMKANDSHECRNCHAFSTMDIAAQKKRVQRFHEEAPKNNETCIDCHQGVAHDLPDGWEDHYEKAVGG